MTRSRLRLLPLLLALATTGCAGAVSTATPPIVHPPGPRTSATDDGAAVLALQRDW